MHPSDSVAEIRYANTYRKCGGSFDDIVSSTSIPWPGSNARNVRRAYEPIGKSKSRLLHQLSGTLLGNLCIIKQDLAHSMEMLLSPLLGVLS